MKLHTYYYNCSPEYIHSIEPRLHAEVESIIRLLPKREKQSEINSDLFWLFTSKDWCYDSIPTGYSHECPASFDIRQSIHEIKDRNLRDLCRTSTTIDARWHADFGKSFDGKLVQVEAQFGKVEAMFKDFCGFRMAYAERRLALGIEIVMADPRVYFAHRKSAVSGMASFNIAKGTLNTIGLDCPIWLIGIDE
jgi:hypothetical protein